MQPAKFPKAIIFWTVLTLIFLVLTLIVIIQVARNLARPGQIAVPLAWLIICAGYCAHAIDRWRRR